jgi:hypothetical protein
MVSEAPLGVHIGRVDEVHALRVCVGHNARGLGGVGLVAKHHGAQAQGGDFQVAFAKLAVLHAGFLVSG